MGGAHRTWALEARPYARFVGLDPEADWLLATPPPGRNAGPGRAQYLSAGLLAAFEDGPAPRAPKAEPKAARSVAATGGAADREAGASEPPFSFLVSPEPGGANGPALLAALDRLQVGRDPDAPRFVMSEAERERLRANRVAAVMCNAAFFEAMAGSAFEAEPKVMRLSSALRERALPPPDAGPFAPPAWLAPVMRKARSDSPRAKATPVVVGVIDDSFAIAHPRFRFDDGASRIFSYWDQDADFDATASTVPFGRELLKLDPGAVNPAWPKRPGLDEILARARALPLSEVYQTPELRDFYPPRPAQALRLASHGTHVLDLAAGAPARGWKGLPAEPPAAEAPAIVAVKLPHASVRETSGAHLEVFLLQGVRHIIDRARQFDPKAKVVIVVSYGFFGGPHDGASQIERALDAEIAAAGGGVEIVLPSGNGRLARSHGVRRFSARDEEVVHWRVHPDDRTPSLMEVWSDPLPQGGPSVVALSLVTPDGGDSLSEAVELQDTNLGETLVLLQDNQIVAAAVCAAPKMHPGRRLFLVWLRPTNLAGPDAVPPAAPSGVWTVRLRRLDPVLAGRYGVWVRRDDSLPGFSSGGRQGNIERDPPNDADDPNLDQHWREVRGDVGAAQRSGSISKIATGGGTVVVGGFDAGPGWRFPVPSSAGGPVAPRVDPSQPARLGPDALGPSQRARGRGVPAAGFFGGGKVSYRGTSVAAPLVGNALAAAIVQPGYPGGRAFVMAAAAASETGFPGLSRPSPALGGAGRLITAAMRARALGLAGEDD